MLLFAHTSITAVKCGMCLVKRNLILQKLQNRAARVIMNMTNDVDHSIALQAVGWKTLEVERKKAKSKMIYKLLNNIGPESLTNLFTYSLIQPAKHFEYTLCLPQPRTNYLKKSFMYDGSFLWNSIPKDIKESKSVSSFR